MILAVLIVAFTAAMLAGWVYWINRQTINHEHREPEECDACGAMIEGDRCKIVQIFEELDGSGGAMTATFHPEHCPIVDPDHTHAGTLRRVS
jgi:hypothetical protein